MSTIRISAVSAILIALMLSALPLGGGAAQKGKSLEPKELEALWKQLAAAPKDAYKAIWTLVEAPRQAVPFLRQRVLPRAPVKPERLQQLLRDLSSADEKVSAAAFKELERLRELARPALHKLLADKLSKTVRQRVEQLLENIAAFRLSSEEVREWRTLEVLEHIGSAEARQVLEGLAKGAPGAWLTEEAGAAAARVRRRLGEAPAPAPPKKPETPAKEAKPAAPARG